MTGQDTGQRYSLLPAKIEHKRGKGVDEGGGVACGSGVWWMSGHTICRPGPHQQSIGIEEAHQVLPCSD